MNVIKQQTKKVPKPVICDFAAVHYIFSINQQVGTFIMYVCFLLYDTFLWKTAESHYYVVMNTAELCKYVCLYIELFLVNWT